MFLLNPIPVSEKESKVVSIPAKVKKCIGMGNNGSVNIK
jgi:hypothetical protein